MPDYFDTSFVNLYTDANIYTHAYSSTIDKLFCSNRFGNILTVNELRNTEKATLELFRELMNKHKWMSMDEYGCVDEYMDGFTLEDISTN